MRVFGLSLFIVLCLLYSTRSSGQTEGKIAFSGKIAVKYKNSKARNQGLAVADQKSGLEKISNLRYKRDRSHSSVLENIVIVSLRKGQDYRTLCDSILSTGNVMYAEPIFQEQLLEVPNDPSSRQGGPQRYLEKIQAYQAWDITKSNESIVIGIVDTGADLDHEDIEGNLYVNAGDPVNGIDDDGNGFIDDYSGYDFADRDNDPTADGNQHGTHVGGIAAASTNNGLGIASVGYRAKWSPLKIFTTTLTASAGSYDAVIYAADNGYDIVNLSWGSANTFSQFNQDIINYAVLENNVVVVAAAGNTPNDIPFYPAAYDNVLSVAASDFDDQKASFSTYHKTVDLMAPGVGIYSTQNNNTYNTDNGTSHAAPQVAGVAALVKDQFPTYDAIQIMERIRATTDKVSAVSSDDFRGKLGTGRLNAFKAVSPRKAYSIRVTDYEFQGAEDGFIFPGDTLSIKLQLVNYLDPVLLPRFELNSLSENARVIGQSTLEGNFLDTYDTLISSEFQVVIEEPSPGEIVELTLTSYYEDGSASTEILDFRISPDYATIKTRDGQFTLQGNGSIGSNSTISESSDFNWGTISSSVLGFFIRQNTLVRDNLPDQWTGTDKTSDFIGEVSIRRLWYPAAAESYSSAFTTSDGSLRVNQYLLTSSDYQKGFVQNYEVVNISSDTLISLDLGFYADPQVVNGALNSAVWDQSNTLYHSWQDSVTFALRIDSQDSIKSTSFNIDSIAALNQNASDQTILDLLAAVRDSLGTDNPTNTASLIWSELDTLLPGQRFRFGIIMATDSNRSDTDAGLAILQDLRSTFISQPPVSKTYYSCEGGNVTIAFQDSEQHFFFSDAYGSDTLATGDSLLVTGISQDTLLFHSRAGLGYQAPIQSIRIEIISDIARFTMGSDTLLVSPGKDAKISFTDKSIDPISWRWDFGNGKQATNIQNPSISYAEAGLYTVRLVVETRQGCTDTTTQIINVIGRPQIPGIGKIHLCPGELLTFSSSQKLRVYISDDDRTLFEAGTDIVVPNISRDTVFYVSQVLQGIESEREKVPVTIQKIDNRLQYLPDFINPAPGALMITPFEQTYQVLSWQIDKELIPGNLPDTLKLDEVRRGAMIDAEISSPEGCQFMISDTVNFSTSAEVSLVDRVICQDTDLIINTPSDSLYGFYADSELTILIAKTRQLVLENIQSDSTIYAINIETLIPGAPDSIEVISEVFEPQIIVDPDSLVLDLDFRARFSASEEIFNPVWYVDSVLQTTSSSPTLFFGTAGRFLIELKGESSNGCIGYDSLYYSVFEELPLSLDWNATNFTVYPNPGTSTQYFLNPNRKTLHLELIDVSGKTVWSKASREEIITLPPTSPGIYTLSISASDTDHTSIRLIRK